MKTMTQTKRSRERKKTGDKLGESTDDDCFTCKRMSLKKRFKRDVTTIEYLPNELFLDIFRYITNVDAVCAFARLNQRFRALTLKYCDTFDFKSVSKAKFDYVIRYHDIHQWRSLRLSDDDNTPGQVTHFCRLFPFVSYISQLEELAMIHTTPKAALVFLPQLRLFPHLVSLSIGSVCGKTIPSLEHHSLKHLVIQSCMHTQWMKNLELESLQHTIEYDCTHEHDLSWPKTLKQLKVFSSKSGDNEIVRVSLRQLSQLTRLAVNDRAWENPPPDGQIWEELITSSMPRLQKFDFCFKFWKDFNPTSDVKHVVSTFSTPFYLREKSWFIQCDSHYQQLSIALIYSLPYAFECLDIVTHSFDESVTNSNSTPTNNVYKNVQTLVANVTCEKMNEALIFERIVNLDVKMSNTLMDWMYSMIHLRQISFENHLNMSPKDFLRLLQNTPHLNSFNISYYSLEVFTNQWKSRKICALLSLKIRSLKICSSGCFRSYVKVHELVHLVRVFHQRCYHFSVTVHSRNVVAGFILPNMRHLRSLKVRLKEHGNDRMITKEWLIQQNSAFKHLNCSVVVDGNEYSFWFGHRR